MRSSTTFIRIISILTVVCLMYWIPGQRVLAQAQTVTTWPTDQPVVALTFDAGSDLGIADELLDILADYNVKATFFLTGQWMEISAEAARRIIREGHDVGNHGYRHLDMAELDREGILRELRETDERAEMVLNRDLKPFFRPPHGAYNERLLDVVGEAGYEYSIMWTVDTLDWQGNSAEQILERVEARIGPGAIILMHVGSETNTAEALPMILDHINTLKLSAITLTELAGLEAPKDTYQVEPGDTLIRIANRFDTTVDELARLNDLREPYLIQIGQLLTVPAAIPPEDTEAEDEDQDEAPEVTPEPNESGDGETESSEEPEAAPREDGEVTTDSFLDRVMDFLRILWGLPIRFVDYLINSLLRGNTSPALSNWM